MDKKLIRQYGTEILSYRLRTARQKKRMQYEDFDKKMIQLHKESRAISEKQRKLGWEPLVPPYQRGWHRSFVLRDDVARSKDAAFFEGILAKINTTVWSHRRDFKVKKRRMGRKNYVVRTQELLRPYDWEFERMQFTDAEKELFYEVWISDNKKRLYRKYVFKEPWRFTLRIRPNIIDKVKIMDPLLKSRQKEIDDFLETSGCKGRYLKVVYGWDLWYNVKTSRDVNILKNKSLNQVLDAIREDQW